MRHVPLTLVHAAGPLVVGSPLVAVAPVLAELREQWEGEARKIIADAVKVVGDNAEGGYRPELNTELFFSAPVPTLVDLSKEALMMVVGCRGQSGLRRVLLGSVSTGLVHHAHCPVAVVHDEMPSLLRPTDLPVLVGIDGSPASELATAIAFDEASWRGVELVALHAVSDADMAKVPGIDLGDLESRAQEILAERLVGYRER
jgi:nucleotide-binding universal stress UspA family protein